MPRAVLLTGIIGCALLLPALSAGRHDQAAAQDQKKEAKKVEMTGKLRTGIVAIGGETTGTILQTKKGTFELDFGKKKELRKAAEKLDGKTVRVVGTLVIRKGVEIKQRRIVTVSTLEESKDK